MSKKCHECGHEPWFLRNIVSLAKWLCGCYCHRHEAKTSRVHEGVREGEMKAPYYQCPKCQRFKVPRDLFRSLRLAAFGWEAGGFACPKCGTRQDQFKLVEPRRKPKRKKANRASVVMGNGPALRIKETTRRKARKGNR